LYSSFEVDGKKHRKKNAKKGGSLSFLFSSFEIEEKKKNIEKVKTIEKKKMQRKEGTHLSSQESQNHKEEKKCKERRELTFLLCFYIWDEALLLPSPLHIPSTLSSPPSSLVSP